jgi:hypothetical protein
VVLQLCAGGKLRCSEKTHRPVSATVGTVAEALSGGDFYWSHAIASYGWPLLIQAGGLAEAAGARLQLTARGRKALDRPAPETLHTLWRRWQTRGLIDEFSRIEGIKGQRGKNVLSAVTPRRQAVAAALSRCPLGEWVPVDAFFARARSFGLTVPRNEAGLWKLYIDDPMYGSLGYAGFHDFPVLEGRYALCVAFEYAAPLGLIDVAYTDPAGAREDFQENWGAEELCFLSRYDGLQAIRLSPLGAYVLGVVSSYQAPEAERNLQVLATGDVVAAGELAPADRLMLDV